MDIITIPASGTHQQYTPSIPKAPAFVPPATVPPVAAETEASSSAISGSTSENEAAVQAALSSLKNAYAVSDQDFTIFKDATGKYITRYVSLRDGKVTYSPEPTLVKPLQLNGESQPSLSISA